MVTNARIEITAVRANNPQVGYTGVADGADARRIEKSRTGRRAFGNIANGK